LIDAVVKSCFADFFRRGCGVLAKVSKKPAFCVAFPEIKKPLRDAHAPVFFFHPDKIRLKTLLHSVYKE
jgi:hypothetical protein